MAIPHLNALLFHDRLALAGDVLANRFPNNVLLFGVNFKAGDDLDVLRSAVRADVSSMPTSSLSEMSSEAPNH
jgi:hypothetical protein